MVKSYERQKGLIREGPRSHIHAYGRVCCNPKYERAYFSRDGCKEISSTGLIFNAAIKLFVPKSDARVRNVEHDV